MNLCNRCLPKGLDVVVSVCAGGDKQLDTTTADRRSGSKLRVQAFRKIGYYCSMSSSGQLVRGEARN